MPVNIFHKRNYYVIISSSAHSKIYCSAFQKRLFCNTKT